MASLSNREACRSWRREVASRRPTSTASRGRPSGTPPAPSCSWPRSVAPWASPFRCRGGLAEPAPDSRGRFHSCSSRLSIVVSRSEMTKARRGWRTRTRVSDRDLPRCGTYRLAGNHDVPRCGTYGLAGNHDVPRCGTYRLAGNHDVPRCGTYGPPRRAPRAGAKPPSAPLGATVATGGIGASINCFNAL